MVALGCRPPALPPVPTAVSPSAPVDLVPAQSRSLCLRARIFLDEGASQQALDAARRAGLLDSSAAHPFALMAEAHAQLHQPGAALEAITEAIRREPTVPALRRMRLGYDTERLHAGADLELLRESGWPVPDTELAIVYAAAVDLEVESARSDLETMARHRIRAADPEQIEALMELAARGDGALALVVGGVRLHRAGAATERVRALAISGWKAAGTVDAKWHPLPLEWRAVISEDAVEHVVSYQRAPDLDAGWHKALAGHPAEALRQLQRVWTEHPNDPTVLEQIWLVHRDALGS